MRFLTVIPAAVLLAAVLHQASYAAPAQLCVSAAVEGDNGRWVSRNEKGWFGTGQQDEVVPPPTPDALADRAAAVVGGRRIKDRSMRTLLNELCGDLVTVRLSLVGMESGMYRFSVSASYSAYRIITNEASGRSAAAYTELWSATLPEEKTDITDPGPVYAAVDVVMGRFLREAERAEPLKPAW